MVNNVKKVNNANEVKKADDGLVAKVATYIREVDKGAVARGVTYTVLIGGSFAYGFAKGYNHGNLPGVGDGLERALDYLIPLGSGLVGGVVTVASDDSDGGNFPGFGIMLDFGGGAFIGGVGTFVAKGVGEFAGNLYSKIG
jgi:hypothetical protein